jgi:hypothetical protein
MDKRGVYLRYSHILFFLIVILSIWTAFCGGPDIRIVDGVMDDMSSDSSQINSADLRDAVDGPESLLFLDGLCFEVQAAKYFQVSVCPFHNITQRRLSGSRETLNGVWGYWETKLLTEALEIAAGRLPTTEEMRAHERAAVSTNVDIDIEGVHSNVQPLHVYSTMVYNSGDKCSGGDQRTARIELACLPSMSDMSVSHHAGDTTSTATTGSLTGNTYIPHPSITQTPEHVGTDDDEHPKDIYVSCDGDGFSPSSCSVTCVLHLPLSCIALVDTEMTTQPSGDSTNITDEALTNSMSSSSSTDSESIESPSNAMNSGHHSLRGQQSQSKDKTSSSSSSSSKTQMEGGDVLTRLDRVENLLMDIQTKINSM